MKLIGTLASRVIDRPAPGPVEEAPAADGTLTKRFYRGTAWAMGGHAAREVIRLGANLVLTRMLLPGDFGLMLLVNVFLTGLSLFSDLGVRASIIQSRRGEDRRFLDTAWSIQIIRGLVLFGVSIALAQPFAALYEQPVLASLIPIAGLTALISGFGSTRLFIQNRRLAFGRLTVIDLTQHVAGATAMILWAIVSPTVWALVAGGIVSSAVRAVLSHVWLPGHPQRLGWDRQAARELFHFGRWIFVSTAVGFLAMRGDQLILGRVLSSAELGLYALATVLAHSLVKLVGEIGQTVLLPVYVRFVHEQGSSLEQHLFRVRGALLALALPPLCILVIWGPEIVQLGWDTRYAGAGWMIQVLAGGGIVSVIMSTTQPIFLAVGDSRLHFVNVASLAALLVAGMATGVALGGGAGCIWGAAVAPILQYPILAVTSRRHGAWLGRLDLLAAGSAAAVVALGLFFF